MNRRPGLPVALAPLLVAAALLVVPQASPAAEPCDFGGTGWPQTQFESGRGKTATDNRELRAPAARGSWQVDGGENGSVSISAWDRDEIYVCAQVVAWSKDEERAAELARSIRIAATARGLRAEGPSQTKSNRWAVSYRIFTPQETDLTVRATNGGITIDGLHGEMDLRTVNGPLRIRDAGGDVRGRTVNGPLDVELTGSRWKGRGLDVETTNGPLVLEIPTRYSAELEAGTTNGPFQVTFPVTVQGKMRQSISATLGSGGPPIRVVTMNGPAIVSRPGETDGDDEDDD